MAAAAHSSLAMILVLALLVRLATSKCTDPRNVVYHDVYDLYDEGSSFERYLNQALDFITNSPKDTGAMSVQVGTGNETVYAVAECYGNCGQCLETVKNHIKASAPRAKGASECTAQCYIHYENFKF